MMGKEQRVQRDNMMGKEQRAQRDKLIDDFIQESMRSLRDKIKAIKGELKTIDKESSPGIKLGKQLNALSLYEHSVVSEFRLLQNSPTLEPKEVKQVFNNCIQRSEDMLKSIKNDRSFLEKVVDFVKNLANFCIKLITFGNTPQFFNTTTKPVDVIKRDINEVNKSLAKFVENTEMHQDRDEYHRPQSL
jgi:hypothetical protein